MDLIIPYEDKLEKNEGAFIDQNGKIIFTYGEHEKFAKDFCDGKNNQLLTDVKYGTGLSYYATHFNEFKKDYNFDGERKDIDIYASSKLTKEQLELYKLWLENYEFARSNLYSDFLVYLLGFDKIETVMRRKVTTTVLNPHIRFYNYYLMDWYIDYQTPMKYNEDTRHFEYIERGDILLETSKDRQAESEINEIKSKVLLKDRHLFFK